MFNVLNFNKCCKVRYFSNVLAVVKTLTHFSRNAMLPHGKILICERNVKNAIFVSSILLTSASNISEPNNALLDF